MKSIFSIFAAIALFTSGSAFAELDESSLTKVNEVRQRYDKEFFKVPGVNGVGTTSCLADTGEQIMPGDTPEKTVYCIVVYTEHTDAIEDLRALYGADPALLEGVWLNYKDVGVILPEPGFTVHN